MIEERKTFLLPSKNCDSCFPRYLLESSRDGDSRSLSLLTSTDLHILPTMNPDGFARADEGKCSGGSYAAGRLNEGSVHELN